MYPDKNFVEEREKCLSELESRLVSSLTQSSRDKVLKMDEKLKKEQSTKETEETLACLPSLQISDIPLEKPKYPVSNRKRFFLF